MLSNRAQMEDLERLSRVALQSISPSQRLEHGLHHTVAFFIMPVFALANAGVTVDGLGDLRVLASGQGLGIFLGLVVGQPLGIFLLSRLCVRLGWERCPKGLRGAACWPSRVWAESGSRCRFSSIRWLSAIRSTWRRERSPCWRRRSPRSESACWA